MRFIRWVALPFAAIVAVPQSLPALPELPTPAAGKTAVNQLIPRLLDEEQQLRGVPFSELILDTTGRKVLPFAANDAVHFVIGFEHTPRETASGSPNTALKFTRWDLVDLSRFAVRLKAEFQGSNRDMYRPEGIVASCPKMTKSCSCSILFRSGPGA